MKQSRSEQVTGSVGDRGFTAIEVIVVVIIFAVIIAVTVPRLLNTETIGAGFTVEDAQDVINLISVAQAYAASNRTNDHWGIHLVDDGTDNCSTTVAADCAVLYKGSSYASRNSTYDQIFLLKGGLRWGDIVDSDFYFNRVSGLGQGFVGTATSTIYLSDNYTTTTVKVYSNGTAQVVKDWFDTRWPYRRKITVDETYVTGDLSGFPILASTTIADLISKSRPDGTDLVFTKPDGITKLNFELEKYDSSTGGLAAWVQTDLASSTNTFLYMYYGNTNAGSLASTTGVWDSNYAGVWHLHNTASSSNSITDSTQFHGNGTPLSPLVSGANIDGGWNFDGIDDRIEITSNAALQMANALTYEFWLNVEDQASVDERLLSKQFSWDVKFNGVSRKHQFTCCSSKYAASFNVMPTSVWVYLAGTFSNGTVRLYQNGKPVTIDQQSFVGGETITTYSQYKQHIGWAGSSSPTKGIFDEVRISKAARSEQWIETSYNSQSSTIPFLSFGSEEALW